MERKGRVLPNLDTGSTSFDGWSEPWPRKSKELIDQDAANHYAQSWANSYQQAAKEWQRRPLRFDPPPIIRHTGEPKLLNAAVSGRGRVVYKKKAVHSDAVMDNRSGNTAGRQRRFEEYAEACERARARHNG